MVQITEELIHVSMFPEAADYSFYSCRKEMLQMVTKAGGLLQTELNNNTDFKTMWKGNTCEKAIPGGTPEHMTALKSYVEANAKFHKKFNKLVHTRSRDNSTYQDTFPFKSLFFLLTDAMQLLKSNCNTVYSGIEEVYSIKIGDKVRFESFFPAKLEYTFATEDATTDDENIGTVFNITSCSVINLDNVCKSEEMDLLISPTEVFTVKNIKTVSNSNDHYTEINLMHSHMHSSSNCSSLVR